MSAIADYILDLLSDDMLSHGLFVQCVRQDQSSCDRLQLDWTDVLKELLLSKKVEIGVARRVSPDYVEFIAWRGTAEERISRAVECVDSMSGHDKEFAYWLCLQENIDRFEERN